MAHTGPYERSDKVARFTNAAGVTFPGRGNEVAKFCVLAYEDSHYFVGTVDSCEVKAFARWHDLILLSTHMVKIMHVK